MAGDHVGHPGRSHSYKHRQICYCCEEAQTRHCHQAQTFTTLRWSTKISTSGWNNFKHPTPKKKIGMYVSNVYPLYSHYGTVLKEILLPRDAFSLIKKRNVPRLRPCTDIQRASEKMTLSLPRWQSRNFRKGLSPEKRIKRWAAPFVEQYNDKCIHVLCPSIQSSGHYFEEKANCNAGPESARVTHTLSQCDPAPTTSWCLCSFLYRKAGTAAAVC